MENENNVPDNFNIEGHNPDLQNEIGPPVPTIRSIHKTKYAPASFEAGVHDMASIQAGNPDVKIAYETPDEKEERDRQLKKGLRDFGQG
ncbi:hypothetical protein KC980_02595 [candidate division WWE3 bacterium]|uniref:Uncharacterized protein n=1 Tax=candidate division WWE3 bacterium TaxID=2053526 RepID=A0A955J3F8_UNCKA|nr:hypothetical protein [candidate division WWE3 bacterium]